MQYQKFSVTPELSPFVACYFVLEGETIEPEDVQSPPNGFCSIVFNYSNPYQAYQNSNERSTVPLAFASGQFISNYHIILSGRIGMVGIVFKPTSLHNFFGLRMSNLVNSRIPFSFLVGDQSDHMLNEIKSQRSNQDRIKILEAFALSYLKIAKTNLSVIDEAVEYIDLRKGLVTVEEVAVYLKISRRYLEKKFLDKVGISPKFYARIKRFSALSNKIAHNSKIDWQEIILEHGFHDQSHLAKEFIEFNQMSPTDYHHFHHEMTRLLK